MTREDLPEPETPVTQVKVPRGMDTSTWRRLFSAAPRMVRVWPLPFRRSAGTGIFFAAGEVVPGDGAGGVHDLLRGAAGHHLASVDPGPGADVHDIVGGPHGVLVVLHHQEGVAQVPEVLHGVQEHVVVPLVEADGGLVQDIEHPHEGGADLGGQADALALAAGEGGRGPAQGQVLEAHRLEEAQAVLDLLEDALGNDASSAR